MGVAVLDLGFGTIVAGGDADGYSELRYCQ